jgi:hypothetical protein
MPIEIFDFVNARGSRLSGRMTAPEVMPHGWVLRLPPADAAGFGLSRWTDLTESEGIFGELRMDSVHEFGCGHGWDASAA